MAEFNPRRLRLARERSRVSQAHLATACDVDRTTVHLWEAGAFAPSEESLQRIVAATHCDQQFLFLGDFDQVVEDRVTFRARTRTKAPDKKAALAAATMAAELVAWLESRFELPPVDIPDLTGQRPEVAADVLRTAWGLGDRPVSNMVHLLESKGVVVLSLAQDTLDIDAFAFWSDSDRPIVMLNTRKSVEHSRMDAAHELAHLALHRERKPDEESEAKTFAGAFLMPRADVQARTPSVPSIDSLAQLKRRWGTSLPSLVVRLHEVGGLTDWQYRMLYIRLSKDQHTKRELNPISEPERSALLKKIFDFLSEQKTRTREVAQSLGWTESQLQEFVFGMGATFLPLQGGRRSTVSTTKPATLKLVGS